MYSDMSRRTIAVSSSNRKAASALVSSVLPTPVGPRNMNEPIGRFGSCRPARARRTAVETALTASPCPTTRWAMHVLHAQELVLLALQHLVDGHARPARDDLRDVVRRHGLLDHAASCPRPPPPRELLLELRDDGIGQLARALVLAAALGVDELVARVVELLLELGRAAELVLLRLPAAGQLGRALLEVGELLLEPREPVARGLVGLLLERLLLDLELNDRAGRSRRAPRAWNRPACAGATPPRRRGRWPCRAGSGR